MADVADCVPAPLSPPPNWVASNHALGWLIDRLLSVEALKTVLFQRARHLVIRSAERQGISWQARREELKAEAEPLLGGVINPSVRTPGYYRVRFHAYDQGNLCWEAACEAEQATDAMALRVWPQEGLSPLKAQQRLRSRIHAAVAPSLMLSLIHI